MSYVRRGLGDMTPFGSTTPDCNTAGGYSPCKPPGYMTVVCMTAAQCAAATAAANASPAPAPAIVTDPATGIMTMVPAGSLVPAGGGGASVLLASVPASSSFLDSAMAWIQANPLLAAGIGVGAVFLLGKL